MEKGRGGGGVQLQFGVLIQSEYSKQQKKLELERNKQYTRYKIQDVYLGPQ